VLVENHGGYSSDGQWLSQVIADTRMDNCGTLPDFGTFCIVHEETNAGSGMTLTSGRQRCKRKAMEFDAEGN
jgi:hypothetical protein